MNKPAASADQPRRSRLPAAERRASIIAAATQVFSEVGYQRGTMSEVARRVGVSEPVVFQNFGSKAAVFAAVIEEATGGMATAMRDRVAANGSVGAWLTEFLAPGHLNHAHARGAHHVLFADAMSQAAEPPVREAIRRAHRTLARTLADLLARGQSEGGVRRDLDPATAAWLLLSLLASQDFRAATMPDRARLEAQLGAMTLGALTVTS
ncbi:MAG TPA: helix-turn-helix domain-containing protein [Rugosimonospora sp.]|jgi:AcrR family transcriptional regulator